MLLDRFNLNNIGENFAKFHEATGKHKKIAVFYATQNLRYLLAAKADDFFVYVATDRIAASRAHQILNEYSGGEVVYLAEKDDLILDIKLNTSTKLIDRISALVKVVTGRARGIVLSAEGLMQYIPNLELFLEATLELKVGHQSEIHEIIDGLILSGYSRKDQVFDKGDFSRRGDILDIWPSDSDLPIRLDFFGDTIDQIKNFSPETMMSANKLDKVIIPPSSDILLDSSMVKKVKKSLVDLKKHSSFELSQLIDENLQKLEINSSSPTLSWIQPFIKEAMGNLFSYIPSNSIIFLDDPHAINDKLELLKSAHNLRVESFIENNQAVSLHKNILMGKKEIYSQAENFTLVAMQHSTGYNPIFYPEYIANLKSVPISKYTHNFELLASDLRSFSVLGSQVFIYMDTDENAQVLQKNLTEKDLNGQFISAQEYEKIQSGESKLIYTDINIISHKISTGFIIPDHKLVLLGQEDIARRQKPLSSIRRIRRSSYVLPEKGDYVVHDKHGIGLSEGIQSVKTRQGQRDYYVILYAKESRLYLPVDHLNEIEKYTGGGEPALHRLGGKQFEQVKERVRLSIKKMAIDLVAIYKKRLGQKGFKYSRDTYWQEQMESSFEFEETDDQLLAIADIKSDMEKGKIMDRLLCGDVGFGKTEVAIRAIFKTILDGKQAALLCPTTILARQHFNTVSWRLQEFGINIVQLSRFVPAKKIKENLAQIATGKANIIIATHRMLSKDVSFHDLGLLVLDEEQKFGVEHKEKIKALRSSINILALSATPIPRTLHMSLSGIRDISILETPPINRMPIETYVVAQSDNIIKDACIREISRGGQAFILYNRVSTIANFYTHIQDLLGEEIVVSYAHGKMSNAELEKEMNDFYNGKTQVLIATTIIENGIDIPLVNTLLVIDSDRLGLSELYQIRGRVGRSNILAYAYFMVPEGKLLTPEAEQRLDAILRNTELGSGMKIAMRDLEIRGAGNILGREQHGNMGRVGYEMYVRLLNESISELQGKAITRLKDIEVSLPGEMNLPKEYINSSSERVRAYRQVADIYSQSDLLHFKKIFEDAYGEIPRPFARLMLVSLIKNLGQSIGAKKIEMNRGSVIIVFYDAEILKNASLFRALNKWGDKVSLEAFKEPIVRFGAKGTSDKKLLEVKEFLLTASEHLEKNI